MMTGTWQCDRARRGGSETCSGGRCGRRRVPRGLQRVHL